MEMTKKKQETWEYKTIDGNWTKHPVAFCWYHDGVLTAALMKVHRFRQRKCRRLDEVVKFK